MTLRALLVLLIALNLGVAAWWLFRSEPAPNAQEAPPSGLARLQLVSERPDLRAPVASGTEPAGATAQTSAPPASEPAAERCYSFGPFADAPALAAAQAALRPLARRVRTREVQDNGGRGWRVQLPAATDRAAADATAERLRSAGFNDLLVVADGAEANSIALGRFSSEARARQHAEALRAAGFAAEAQPLGEVRNLGWVDLAAAEDFDAPAARGISGASQSRTLDCAALR